MADNLDTLDAAIAEIAVNPAEITTDAGSIKEHDLDKLLRYRESVAARTAPSRPPFAITRGVPPGAVGSSSSCD